MHDRRLTLAMLLVASASATAFADCQPSPPPNGATVTCSGSDSNGLNFSARDNVTVNVLGDASVTAGRFAIRIGDNGVVNNAGFVESGTAAITVGTGGAVTNSGTVIGDRFFGVLIDGLTSTLTNSGSITAPLTAVFLETSQSGAVINSGTITSAGTAVRFDSDSATLVNSGSISGGVGVQVLQIDPSGRATIANSGRIFGSTFAVTLSSDIATVNNRGSITSDDTAVQLSGAGTNTVINDGTIAGLVQGILIGGSAPSILNNGTITGPIALTLTTPGTVTNNGTIDGQVDMSNGAGNLLTNNGLITVTAPGVGVTHLVDGTFTQGASGTLVLRVDPFGNHDTLSVTGAANLGGTLHARLQPGHYADAQTYTGVVVGALSGAFANSTTSSEFLTATATYVGGTRVDLTVARIHFDAVQGETQDEHAVAAALERAYESNAPSGLTIQALTLEEDIVEADSLHALDSLDGEVATAVQNPSFAMGAQFTGALFAQLQRWRRPGGGGVAQAQSAYRVQVAAAAPMFGVAQAAPGGGTWPPDTVGPRWNAWLSGFGLSGSRDGDASAGSVRLSYRTGGGAAGADFELAPNLLLGAAVGASGADFTLDGLESHGTARTFFVGLYGSWTMGPLYVDAAANYGHAQFTTNRLITLPNLTERATGEFGGNQVGGRFEVGWRFPVQRVELTPFAGVSVQALRQAAYDENSIDVTTSRAGIAGLSYDAQTTTSVRSFLGGQAAATFMFGERTSVTPRVRLAWAHEFTSTRQINASFLSIPGAAFTEHGARPVRDAMIVSAGLEIAIGRNAALYAQFDGDLGGGGHAYAGSGGLRLIW